jgi:2',3'-cyclic-nucleotide 2'-phosphodiesterase (5'-nucleotidase family)
MKKYLPLFFLLTGLLYSSDLYIIFTANVNGIMEDCRCGDKPLGGLARVKTFVSEFKIKHPNTLFIDGGDFFNPYKFPDQNNAMSDLLQYLEYDVITPGDQEFVEGYDYFQKHLQRYQQVFLASNCNFGNKVFKQKINKIPVTIISYLSPNCFSFINKPEEVVVDSVLTLPSAAPGKNLRLLLFHGEAREGEKMIKQSPEIDLVLLGHAQRLDTWEAGGIRFVGGGLDSELVMVIAATYKGTKWEFEVTPHSMDQSVAENKQIKILIEQQKTGRKER